jgi:hypothetical protein
MNRLIPAAVVGLAAIAVITVMQASYDQALVEVADYAVDVVNRYCSGGMK